MSHTAQQKKFPVYPVPGTVRLGETAGETLKRLDRNALPYFLFLKNSATFSSFSLRVQILRWLKRKFKYWQFTNTAYKTAKNHTMSKTFSTGITQRLPVLLCLCKGRNILKWYQCPVSFARLNSPKTTFLYLLVKLLGRIYTLAYGKLPA